MSGRVLGVAGRLLRRAMVCRVPALRAECTRGLFVGGTRAMSHIPAVDDALTALDAGRTSWFAVSPAQRADILETIIQDFQEVMDEWVRREAEAKGQTTGELYIAACMPTLSNMRVLVDTLQAACKPKTPLRKDAVTGQWIADVMPASLIDRLMYTGFRAELWIQPGCEPTQAQGYAERSDSGSLPVCLVLGAGNVTSMNPMDILDCLFVKNELVLLKMHPVNEYTGPLLEKAFGRLISMGVLRIIYGGADVGAYACQHAKVDHIHMTGSAVVHDLIVWGPPDQQQQNKANNTPVVKKRVTSELGCVSPVIVVPGVWSKDEIDFQAEQVASMVTHNASFNCNAAKVLVVSKSWAQRDQFVDGVRAALAKTPAKKAYYPGAAQRYRTFLDKYPQAEKLGPSTGAPEEVPWTLIDKVEIVEDQYCFKNEAFCGILTVTDLEAGDSAAFLREAVTFANDKLWGTLSCNVFIHPKTQQAIQPVFEQAVRDLRYGSVAINAWSALCYAIPKLVWGAFPGHTLDNVGSGIGFVHNALMFDHPQKSVVYAPFKIFPKPVWFASHKKIQEVGRRVAVMSADPSLLSLPGIALRSIFA
eukprot:m.569840 g.569840  ORF g.569840 m.569840 type:complete len:589 (-) comp57843_c0_seq2:111-1877(-)